MFSIVIPAYQAGEEIGRCLQALHRQTVPRGDYEIIVVDDGSEDNTSTAAQVGADRVIILPHGGPAAARNAGIREAGGEVILFTDADCEPAADWLAEMVRPLADPSVAGVTGAYRTQQGEIVARLAQCEFEERYDRLERFPSVDFIATYAAAFRSQVLRDVGGFDPAFPVADHEDVELSYRLVRAGHRLIFNRQAVVYHRHPATWRAYVRRKLERGYWRTVVYRLHPEKALHDSYTPGLAKFQILLLYLTVCLAALTIFRPILGWAVGAGLAGLAISSLPFVKLVWRRDPAVAVWAPLFILARTLAFAMGIAGGLIGMLFFKPTLSTRS